MINLQIFPTPQKITAGSGRVLKPCKYTIHLPEKIAFEFAKRDISFERLVAPCTSPKGKQTSLKVIFEPALTHEGYRLSIQQSGMRIFCGGAAGAYYAVLTLEQIFFQSLSETLPCLELEDQPALAVRGILLDIGRNKIPTTETLILLLDRFSKMKINHLQLYMDGFCFTWDEYQYLFSNETPISAKEIQTLAAYAKSKFIDLVPNLNSLGHMEQWLVKPQFLKYAECENGFDFQGLYHRQPGTIDPQDKKATQWVYSLFDQLLENFDSEYVNVNLDEPFELGKGKNKQLAETQGAHAPYLLQVDAMQQYCTAKKKKMMMWGDVVLENPDAIPHLPKDVTLLHWMYEGDGKFEPDAKLLQQSGLSYLLCPGTSCWCSYTGRSERMLKNITDAADCAIRYGGKGILITDWGDLGHWQYISASLVPFAIGAGLAWAGTKQTLEQTFQYCDSWIFQDPSKTASKTFYELGNYYQFENAPLYSTTLCCGVMTSKHRFTSKDDFEDSVNLLLTLSANLAKGMNIPLPHSDIRLDAQALENHMRHWMENVQNLSLSCPDGQLIQKEMLNASRFVLHGLRLYTAMTTLQNQPGAFTTEMDALFQDMDTLLKEHFTLWKTRNKTGGFATSIEQLLHLMRVYNKYR